MTDSVEVTDPDAVRHLLYASYAEIRMRRHGTQSGMRLTREHLGSVRIDHVVFMMSFEAVVAPLGVLAVVDVLAGAVRHGFSGRERGYLPGSLYLGAPPHLPHTVGVGRAELDVVLLDPALVDQLAAGVDGRDARDARPVRFTEHSPVSAAAARKWRSALAYVRASTLSTPAADRHTLQVSGAAQLLAGTALATFPNDALPSPTATDRNDASDTTLRSALAFIDDHAHEPLTVGDIAAAAHVTVRAVQLAFRRHLDTTPMAYLRKVRLEHVHYELQLADPDHTTVSAVAGRWGFFSPGRLSAVYGRPPNDTLRNR